MFVMGHEMAHFVLGHTLRLIALLTGLVFVGLFVVQRSARALIARHQERFGFTDLADPASLPLILLLFNATFLVVTPAALAFTRYNEREADRFGLEITRDNHAAATAFVKLQRENLGNPRPGLLYKLWRASHPPLGERIDFCNDYRPWETGAPLEYAPLLRGPAPP
jgi:Zn-dependent protease with chaperone function